jgi:hypothetical protein
VVVSLVKTNLGRFKFQFCPGYELKIVKPPVYIFQRFFSKSDPPKIAL